ncbi:hypothetical protein [Streptomyces sp. NPDC005799]|uniref:hypothetical protein n=1 Tax=Streptomyces sp. NPDC005799 TaxID=3154678 RepID=UPI0033F91AE2
MSLDLRTIIRTLLVYGIAALMAAIAATAVTVPLGPQPAIVITGVWTCAAASTGYTTLLVLDGYLTGRKAGQR